MKCYCDSCNRWSPKIDLIREALPEHLIKDFDLVIEHLMTEAMDINHSEAKLDGSWPGWEWMKDEIDKRNK